MQALSQQPWLVAMLAVAVGICVAAGVFLALGRANGVGGAGLPVPRFLIATLLGLGLLLGLALFAIVTDVPFDRLAYAGFGVFVGGCTLLRPAWFWEHPRARAVRSVLGDGGTAAVYLIVAVVMLYLGLFTNVGFGHHS